MTFEDIKKLFTFSWAQAFSDPNGKSSITSISAFTIVCTGCVGFLYSLFLKDTNGMMYASGIIAVGAGLLGYRKSVNGKPEDMKSEPTQSS